MRSISLKNISFEYDDKVVFNDFNIKFTKGTTFLIGNNGSGKSTLIKIVTGKFPFLGDILFDDKAVRKDKLDMFVLDLDYVKTLKGKIKDLLNTEEIVKILGLDSYLESDIRSLSISLQVKVSFGLLLNSDKSSIFVDDMLCWLNKIDKEIILKKIKTLSKRKIVVMVTNNLEDTLIANRVILLNDGKVILDDDLDNFYENEKILNDNGFNLPFIVDLSLKLKLYNSVDKIYFNQRKLVDDLWK